MAHRLTWEQVRQWRLKVHHLDERVPLADWRKAVVDIGGLHAQMDSAAELALWNRVEGIVQGHTARALWVERSLVKSWAMRGTLYFIDADEYPAVVAALKATQNRQYKGAWLKYFKVTADEVTAYMVAIPKVLNKRTLTRKELTAAIVKETGDGHLEEAFNSGWGSLLKPASFAGSLCFGPEQGQNVTFVRPDQWLKGWHEVDSTGAFDNAFRTYLTAFGPTTREEFERWWGAEPRDAKAMVKRLGDELIDVDVEGWEAMALASELDDIQSAPPARSVRLLPHFDPYVVSIYFHREHFVDSAFNARVYRAQGWISPVVLVDGKMVGVWSSEIKKDIVKVSVDWFEKPGKDTRALAEAEAKRLGTYYGVPAEVSG